MNTNHEQAEIYALLAQGEWLLDFTEEELSFHYRHWAKTHGVNPENV
jgi:hypothetical protein